ncbi:MAG: tyrosine-type recombinase/integrase [bacterium]
MRTYAESWLPSAEGNLKASSVSFYRGHLNEHILPALGDRVVSSIRRRDCRELVATCRGKGLALATVKGIVRTLSTVLSQAVEDDLLEANPALRMGRYLRRGDEPEPEVEPYTRDEAALLLDAAREKFPRWYPLLLTALRSGMRQGELLALRWVDVDFAGRFIRVERNVVRGTLTTPKNHQRRRVDISAQLLSALFDLRRRERARWLVEGKSLPDPVFASDAGTMLDDANVRHVYGRILTAAGLRHLKFHGLRHTYAALLLGSGATLTYVRDQMGHKSIQVTADVYGRFIPAGSRSVVDALDDQAATQPNATQAQPEGDFGGLEFPQVVGEPSFHQLEPHRRMAQPS